MILNLTRLQLPKVLTDIKTSGCWDGYAVRPKINLLNCVQYSLPYRLQSRKRPY